MKIKWDRYVIMVALLGDEVSYVKRAICGIV
jgi:hypothetical protein